MKPIRELDGGPLMDRAKALLSAAAPEPESPARKARIWAALQAEPKLSVGRRLRRPAFAVAGLLLAAGAAAAGGVHLSNSPTATTPRPAVHPDPREGDAAQPRTGEPPPATVAPPPPQAAAEAAAGSPLAASATEAPRLPPRATATHDPSTTTSARAADAALVHGAVKALRRDGDPARAAALLDRYAERDPNGPLAEEALALGVEAAVARRDPAARALARDYLTRYPSGRYREAARSALAGAPAP